MRNLFIFFSYAPLDGFIATPRTFDHKLLLTLIIKKCQNQKSEKPEIVSIFNVKLIILVIFSTWPMMNRSIDLKWIEKLSKFKSRTENPFQVEWETSWNWIIVDAELSKKISLTSKSSRESLDQSSNHPHRKTAWNKVNLNRRRRRRRKTRFLSTHFYWFQQQRVKRKRIKLKQTVRRLTSVECERKTEQLSAAWRLR